MKDKQLKILQKPAGIHVSDEFQNFIVLFFIVDGKIVDKQVVQLPKWFVFYHRDFKYYIPSLN